MGIFDNVQKEIETRDKREGSLTVEAAAEYIEESLSNTQQMLDTLAEKGYLERVEEEGGWVYRTRFARKRGRELPAGIWSALGQRTKEK